MSRTPTNKSGPKKTLGYRLPQEQIEWLKNNGASAKLEALVGQAMAEAGEKLPAMRRTEIIDLHIEDMPHPCKVVFDNEEVFSVKHLELEKDISFLLKSKMFKQSVNQAIDEFINQ